MTLVQGAAAMTMAGVLLWAALEKARELASTAATIRELGLPPVIASPAALLITAAEIAVALAVLFRPESTLTHTGVVLLAGLFALAGLIALSSGKEIRCHCFGAGGRGHLGKTQLLALIPWLAGVALLRLGAREAPHLSTATTYFAATCLTIACVRGLALRKALVEAAGDRLSAQEMYRWLQSR